MTFDIEALIEEAQLPQTTATLCLRADMVAQWEKLYAQWRVADEDAPSLGDVSPKGDLQRQLRELGDEMAKHQVTFTFQALPGQDYSSLIAKHPPLGDDKTKFRWNKATFEPALIAACLTDPAATPEQVAKLLAKLSHGQQQLLAKAASDVNDGTGDIPFDGAVYAESPTSDG